MAWNVLYLDLPAGDQYKAPRSLPMFVSTGRREAHPTSEIQYFIGIC